MEDKESESFSQDVSVLETDLSALNVGEHDNEETSEELIVRDNLPNEELQDGSNEIISNLEEGDPEIREVNNDLEDHDIPNEDSKEDNNPEEDNNELKEDDNPKEESNELMEDSEEQLKDVSLTDKEDIALDDKDVQLSETELEKEAQDPITEEQPDNEDLVEDSELNAIKPEDEASKEEVNTQTEHHAELKEDQNIQYMDDTIQEKSHLNAENYAEIVESTDMNFNRNDSRGSTVEDTVQEYIKKGSNAEATATAKFVMMPSGQVVTLACLLSQTLQDLKTHFSLELKMPSNLIMLLFDGKTVPDTTTLADLGVGPNGTIQLEILSADPVNTPLKQYRPRQEYHMPDVITVRVTTEDCEAKDVVVEIERSRNKKPFLGGFRNKNTGVEYHNAAAQTMQKQRPLATSERFCRDTQTCEQKNNLQQTFNTTSTQMTGIGCYISNMEDKLLSPKYYVTADEHHEMFLTKVIILQKNFRSWLAKRYVKKLKEDKEKRLAWERREDLRKKKEKEERIKKEYTRRINPHSKSDFDLLLHCLEKWRLEEIERINSDLTGAERKAALCMLLDQETELLSAIERHKNEANQENREKQIMAFLEKAAAPKKWAGPDGKLTFLDTPYTIRAKELRDIYNSINMKYLTQDERLDVLLTLKHTVKEHDCKLTQEITELIDREADLLMRGVKESNLTGLRKRISTLYLQYIKTPAFNPEAARLLKIPQDPSTLRKNINYCRSCGSYLPSTEFFITSNTSSVGRCKKCEKIENDGRQREDHNYYRVMLKALRKSEEALQDDSSICYLLQEKDLRYLVENIWSNQSVLSAWDDIYDLVLARWDKHQEWSPWNCILLTHDEAEAHKKLFSLEEGYGQVFIHKVTQKHNFARNYFSRLPGMAEVLRKKIDASEKEKTKGPSVAGHSVAKAQKV
ncbi:IQ and ubiquitin-like domain-containing protein [Biomphalaria pfeifferi]|uniref:IQ and ubiquitin-like domain-containing protein n=1 Tax=Biomphalaria pfeifferi TaxID=112525 RepID=A0AAD8F5E9_BIOPF|nr:IQ and ubiquitin-like domain-containing protein [Biomphalaria pfeifferi]